MVVLGASGDEAILSEDYRPSQKHRHLEGVYVAARASSPAALSSRAAGPAQSLVLLADALEQRAIRRLVGVDRRRGDHFLKRLERIGVGGFFVVAPAQNSWKAHRAARFVPRG